MCVKTKQYKVITQNPKPEMQEIEVYITTKMFHSTLKQNSLVVFTIPTYEVLKN